MIGIPSQHMWQKVRHSIHLSHDLPNSVMRSDIDHHDWPWSMIWLGDQQRPELPSGNASKFRIFGLKVWAHSNWGNFVCNSRPNINLAGVAPVKLCGVLLYTNRDLFDSRRQLFPATHAVRISLEQRMILMVTVIESMVTRNINPFESCYTMYVVCWPHDQLLAQRSRWAFNRTQFPRLYVFWHRCYSNKSRNRRLLLREVFARSLDVSVSIVTLPYMTFILAKYRHWYLNIYPPYFITAFCSQIDLRMTHSVAGAHTLLPLGYTVADEGTSPGTSEAARSSSFVNRPGWCWFIKSNVWWAGSWLTCSQMFNWCVHDSRCKRNFCNRCLRITSSDILVYITQCTDVQTAREYYFRSAPFD